MLRNWNLFKKFFALELSTKMAYKADFIIKCFALSMMDIISPLVALLIYKNSAGIPGWSFEQFVLFQGTFILVFGLNHAIFIRLPVQVVNAVRHGTFDKILVKPFNPLTYLTFSSVDLDGFAEVITGIVIIAWAMTKLNLSLVSPNFAFYLFLIIIASIFQYAVVVMISSCAFLFVKSWALFDIFFRLSQFARYPLTIYNAGLTLFLTFIFPAAISAHYPVEALLKGISLLSALKVSLPVFVFLTFSLFMWKAAMKKYTSAGG